MGFCLRIRCSDLTNLGADLNPCANELGYSRLLLSSFNLEYLSEFLSTVNDL